jgi:hypothetical protein
MSETSNSSEETVRPSSPQRQRIGLPPRPEPDPRDGPTQLTSDMSLESTAFDDADDTGIHGSRWSGNADNVSRSRIRPSSVAGDHYNVIPISMTNYLQPVYWKTSRNHNPVFRSDDEKEQIQRSRDQQGVRHSEFWVHPVRYEPAINEPNVHRTVQIDHIPKEATIHQVLKEVCWGTIDSIQLVDIGNFKGDQGFLKPAPGKFARVVFYKDGFASNFQRYAHNKPLTILGQQVRVYVQMEHTYPRTAEADEAIFDEGLTRILTVFGLDGSGRDQLPAFLKKHGVNLLSWQLRHHFSRGDENDIYAEKTVLEFRSILHAFRAFKAMRNGGYENAIAFKPERDYCARKVYLPHYQIEVVEQ